MKIQLDFEVGDLEDENEEDYTEIATDQKHIAHETRDAVKFLLDGVEVWVPRSQCRQSNNGHIWVTTWYIEEKEIDV